MQYDTQPGNRGGLHQALNLPLIGALLRALLGSGTAFTFFLVAAAVVLWGLAVATWGVPALYLPPLVATPVALFTLVWISRG